MLTLAHDLADRLIMAFDEETKTGLPHPRINLQTGVPSDGNKVSCAAGAGSLILEFGKFLKPNKTWSHLGKGGVVYSP